MTENAIKLPIITPITVKPDWIDENDHVNFSRYFQIFIEATDRLCEQLGTDSDDYLASGSTTFTGDYHVTFLNEANLGDPLVCHSFVLAVSDKKLVLRHELRHAEEGWVSAVAEELILSVDFESRRVAPFPQHMYEKLQGLALSADEAAALPNQARAVSLTGPRPERT
ncbi:MAG: thioesterase family protein [Pseudomonadota bacterium]